MMRASIFRLLNISTIGRMILALMLAGIVVAMAVYWVERSGFHIVEKEVTYGSRGVWKPTKPLWTFEIPGLQKPHALPATAAKIDDLDEVIGVVVKGKSRAYWLEALKYPSRHIVNDVVAGAPVSVTYCDNTDCTRVYTGRDSSTPLDVNLGGLYGTEMLLKVRGVRYLQATGKPFEPGAGVPSLPYADYPWERTTWKAWRQRHPETDVFVGQGGTGATSNDSESGKPDQ